MVARQIGVVGTVAEVICEWQIFVDFLNQSSIVILLVEQISRKVVKADYFSSFLAYFVNKLGWLQLLVGKELAKSLQAHARL